MQNDDRVCTAPERFIGREIVITNKMDGGNTCLHRGEVYARSTGQVATAAWFAQVRKYHAWKTYHSELFFYGEDIAALHSIRYSTRRDETYFVFNILRDTIWLAWDDVVQIAAAHDLPVVGVEFRGVFTTTAQLTKWLAEKINSPFHLGEREGFVIRTVDEFHTDQFSDNVCKYVRAGHVQTNEHWKMNWQWNDLV